MGKYLEFLVTPGENGLLLKYFLKKRIGLSTKTLKKLKLRPDGLLVNGVRAMSNLPLCPGDRVVISAYDDAPPEYIEPMPLPIKIIYEDSDILVVDKPSGMPVHPSRRHVGNTLANAVAYYAREQGEGYTFRVVTRLDKNTSGLVLIAKHALSANWNRPDGMRTVRRFYIGIARGNLLKTSGLLEFPIAREKEGEVKRVVREDGQYAATRFRVIKRFGDETLIAFRLLTGRTHQIRVHMAHIGHPLKGDTLYNPDAADEATALRAVRLTLNHPMTGKRMRFKC